MSPDPEHELPSREEFIRKSIKRKALRQNLSTCSICRFNFDVEHIPVTLPCGHFFGEECILAWLTCGQHNANTCPMDRTVLFHSSANAVVPYTLRRTFVRNTHLIQSGEIIAIHSNITRVGFRRLVNDLWKKMCELARELEERELEATSVDEQRLRLVAEEVIPDGVEAGEREMTVLVSLMRQMLVGTRTFGTRGRLWDWRHFEGWERAYNELVGNGQLI